ncbi:DinB family protein [Streptomyces sp. NPDC088789]|uniref:DinB family protein n=1 Tax=Streptomyces sp. NPDC088789 TaxID=3365899 RepID=UPI0038061CF5
MSSSRHDLLRRQSELAWALFEYHLERLTADDFLWEPAGLCWTLRQDATGTWVPDWADTEPEPVPVPTAGWVSWHLGWWLGATTDQVRGRTPRARTDVVWPGPDDAVAWLRALGEDWRGGLEQLTEADLDGPAGPLPWQDDPERTLADTLAWATAELMKNVAEIGQLRLLRTASRH